MLETAILPTIDGIAEAEWDALDQPGIERHAYLRAVEQAGLAGFTWRYILVREGGRLVAAATAFVTDYALDTTLGGDHARLTAALRHVLPRLMTQRMAALGSPCTETAAIAFAPGLPGARRQKAAAALVAALESIARETDAVLIVAKDVGVDDAAMLAPLWRVRGGRAIASLPVASLAIDFGSVDDYLARLSPGTRRDMRRKLRACGQVRVERVTNLAPVLDRVMALYNQTRARADMRFEELTPAYFTGVLGALGPGAHVTLYWQGDQLAAANLLLEQDGLLLDKFFCMDAALGRPLNLYYLSWFENVRYCLDRQLVRYQAGQAAYADKLRLGCTLEPTTIWFRHRHPLMNRLLGAAAPFLAPDVPEQVAA